MSGGELRDYIQIESLINAVSANGDYSTGKTWGIVDKVWAKIKYMQGSENSDERDATIGKAMIKIRWRDDISNKMRTHTICFKLTAIFCTQFRRFKADVLCTG